MPQIVVAEVGREPRHLAASGSHRALERPRCQLAPKFVDQHGLGLPPRHVGGEFEPRVCETGTDVRDVSLLSGSAGYWTSGETTPRMKSGDLQRAGLADPNLHVVMTGAGMWAPGLTGLGGQFLQFVSDPRTS